MKYFSIHNMVGIEVDGEYRWSDTLIINIPLFTADKNTFDAIKSKIRIIYKRRIELKGAYEVVPNLFINRNTDQIFDKKYGVLISKTENGYTISCNQECNEWLMMILEYSLLKNKASLIHSAGVVKSRKAIIFPSWGGVGKTASVAKLVREEGFQLLGDDLVLLTEEGKVYAFPKKFVLYEYHRKIFGEVMQSKKLLKGKFSQGVSEFIPFVKAVLRHVPLVLSWARKHNPQSKRVSPYEIFGEDKIGSDGEIVKCIWLERAETEKTTSYETDSYQLAAKALVITLHELFENRLEEFFIALCAECFDYKVLFDDSIDFISKAIGKAQMKQLFIPQEYPLEDVVADVAAFAKQEE